MPTEATKPKVLTVAKLFTCAGLMPCGPVEWGTPISERHCGVYVVALVQKAASRSQSLIVDYLKPSEQERWLPEQPIIYIGRTRRPLLKRLDEFYRHMYGRKSPHRGGQAVKLLQCDLWVYWAPSQDPAASERDMIAAFVAHAGRLPFANRRR